MEKYTKLDQINQILTNYYSEEAITEPFSELSLFDYMDQNTKDFGDLTAISNYQQQLQFEQWKIDIMRTAQGFQKLGVQKGDYVPICSFGLIEVWQSVYALNLIGAIPKMIDPRTDVNGILHILNEDHCKYMLMLDAAYSKIRTIVDKTNLEKIIPISPINKMTRKEKFEYRTFQTLKGHDLKIPNDSGYLKFDDFMESEKSFKNSIHSPYLADDTAIIIYTSGTSGPKKGVELSNRNINELAQNYHLSNFNFAPNDRLLNIMPPFITYGFAITHLAFSSGVENCIISFFDPKKFDRLILEKTDKKLHVVGVPSHYDYLMKSKGIKEAGMSHVETAAIGGAPCTPSKEAEINTFLKSVGSVTLTKGYGLTEGASSITTTYNNKDPRCNKIGSVGIPLPKNKVMIVDENMNPVPANVEGQVLVSGPTIMNGYHHNEEETKNIFYNQYIKTGDIGKLDEDGVLFIIGRQKNMFIRFDGHNVFPEEIDKVLAQHPAVDNCITISVPDKSKPQGELAKSFVVLQKGYQYPWQKAKIKRELIDLCSQNLPERDVPSFYQFLNELPIASSGKVDILKLKEQEEHPKVLFKK